MIKTLKQIFDNQENVFVFAYLFGSRALGNESESSDIDIAVYLNKEVKRDHFDVKTDLYMQLNRTLKQNNIDIVIMNQFKNIILLNQIITHGKLLCDKNPTLRMNYEQKILHRAIDFTSQRKMVMGL